MKQHAFIIIICLGVIAAMLLLWLHDKQQAPTGDTTKAQVIADHDTLAVHGVEYRRVIDSLSISNYRLDSANKSLVKGQAIKERQLNAKAAEVNTLVDQIREINQDTGFFGHLLDSLQQQVQSLTFLIVQYEQYADSINNVNDSLKINYEAAMKEKGKRIAEVEAAYEKLFKAYQTLFADSQVLAKDLKRQKLKTKIVAVLAGAAAVLGLIKY